MRDNQSSRNLSSPQTSDQDKEVQRFSKKKDIPQRARVGIKFWEMYPLSLVKPCEGAAREGFRGVGGYRFRVLWGGEAGSHTER